MIILQAAIGAAIFLSAFIVFLLISIPIMAYIAYAIFTRKGTEGMDKRTKRGIVLKSILLALAIAGGAFILVILRLSAGLQYS